MSAYFFQGLGVFLGVLAGTAVTLLSAWMLQRRSENQRAQNLRFELELNVGKIDTWLEELTRLRHAVNGDALDSYFGYFDLSRIISVTANSMLQTGLLYKHLTHDQIGSLQEMFSEFSWFGEKYVNDQVQGYKQTFLQGKFQPVANSWIIGEKAKAVQQINFWEQKWKDHRTSLLAITQGLPSTARRAGS